MEYIAWFAYVLVGAIAGLSGGLLGLSGGVIAVPCLVLIFSILSFPQAVLMHTAIGTALAAMVINGLASTTAHHKRGGVMWDLVFAMIPGVFLGCLLGAFIAHFLSSVLLEIIFGLFVSLLGARVLLQKKKKGEVKRPDRTLFTWIGLGIGTLSSLLGIGGGTFTVPMLLSYRYPEKKAVGTSAATGLFITFLAALGYLYFGLGVSTVPNSLGYIYLPAFAIVGLTTILFAPMGARLAHKIDGKKLRRIFAATLIIVGILMIFH